MIKNENLDTLTSLLKQLSVADMQRYRECKPYAQSKAKQFRHTKEDFEDAYQEAWYRALRAQTILVKTLLFIPCYFLAAIIQNIFLEQARTGKRERITMQNLEREAKSHPCIWNAQDANLLLEAYNNIFYSMTPQASIYRYELPHDSVEELKSKENQLSELPENILKAIYLKYFFNRSYAQIAQILDTTEDQVGQLLHIGRKKLKNIKI